MLLIKTAWSVAAYLPFLKFREMLTLNQNKQFWRKYFVPTMQLEAMMVDTVSKQTILAGIFRSHNIIGNHDGRHRIKTNNL